MAAPTKQEKKLTPEQMFALILKGAEAGDVKLQRDLANLYIKGEGIAMDAIKAGEWLQKAADTGDATAQSILGLMYRKGEVLPRNTEKAVELLQKSAAQGNADAQSNLGQMYKRGEGVTKDSGKAVELYQKASAQGNGDALASLGTMYANGEDLPKNISLGIELISKSANQGNAWGQVQLGYRYWHGDGVPKDAGKGLELVRKAAEQGLVNAQSIVADLYWNGREPWGDKVLAYAWINIVAGRGDGWSKAAVDKLAMREKSISIIGDRVQHDLTPTDIAEAQRLSSNWKLGQALVREGREVDGNLNKNSEPSILTKQGAGTVFYVTATGQAITNNHVVNGGCKELRIAGRDGVVKVITTDVVTDLALIQVPGGVNAVAVIDTEQSKTRQGDDIVVFGYPLNSVLSSGGNLTPGIVSALTGLNNNTNQIQITAPIQPGSSGSPVLNKKGQVVGVVSMKLSDSKMVHATGQVGQNVNFAVSGQTLKSFLDAHKVDYSTGGMVSFNKSTADIADEARKWTMVVECWK